MNLLNSSSDKLPTRKTPRLKRTCGSSLFFKMDHIFKYLFDEMNIGV